MVAVYITYGFFVIVVGFILYKIGYMKAKKKYQPKDFKPKTFQ